MEATSPTLAASLQSGRPTVIEFYAKWCGDCKAMAKTMKTLEQQYGSDKINFVVLDAEKDANSQLVNLFRVDAIPHFAFISADRTLLTTLTGFLPPGVMEKQMVAFSQGVQLPFCGPDMCGLTPEQAMMQKGRR
ncbi:hypothetical protein GUITHDRAFT_109179 [Guillardia theta CCMP2712]|uniref:Thioredoxin domain-containing protein n=1 Tax=Guillardia theta (strain CCMP2712) TaxID=905079 RepID=L1J885_GUITC|nr:hypothetical protein GUITHDRAFT_109179 [Guillardia theta CCMP2712]EKX44753.1 hypothetical protein GUITHDRAFT_109179 [Guillardia theta CCMP2712]|eukprot:XP_005831733.1 hypothetical protein GUITHDRAFT_109179 [Guillardia theta CCMP2712]